MAEKGSLIPDDAQRLLEQQDAERAKARAKLPVGTKAYDQFRSNFVNNYADQIRLMQRGAIVTSTVADEKRRRGIPVTDWLDEERPYTVEIPDGKPAETLVQARRVIWWAKVKRGIREFTWLKLRRSVGTWMRNAISGVRSALRTLGSRATR
jgi:hypothetical protein